MRDDNDFAVGDVVKLAGSSTRMCIHDVDPDHPDAAIEGEIVCRWFNAADELQEMRFKPAELIAVNSK